MHVLLIVWFTAKQDVSSDAIVDTPPRAAKVLSEHELPVGSRVAVIAGIVSPDAHSLCQLARYD